MAYLQQVAVELKSIEAEKPTKTFERKDKFVFNKCCFCVPLKIGCHILANLFLIGIVVTAFGFSLEFFYFAIIENNWHYVHRTVKTTKVLHAVNLVLVPITIPFNILCNIGLYQNRRSFVKVYIMFQLAYLLIGVIVQNILLFSMGLASHYGNPKIIIVLALINLVFNIYFILVMRSQYVKMGEAANKLPGILYRRSHVVDTP